MKRRWLMALIFLAATSLLLVFLHSSPGPKGYSGIGVLDRKQVRSVHPNYGELRESEARSGALRFWLTAETQKLEPRRTLGGLVQTATVAAAVQAHEDGIRQQQLDQRARAEHQAVLAQEWQTRQTAIDGIYLLPILNLQWKLQILRLDKEQTARLTTELEALQKTREQLLAEQERQIWGRLPVPRDIGSGGPLGPDHRGQTTALPETAAAIVAQLELEEKRGQELRRRIDADIQTAAMQIATAKGLHCVLADVRVATAQAQDITAETVQRIRQ